MIELIECIICKHYLGKLRCKAFPKVIPKEIVLGKKEHNKVLDGQRDKYIFEPKKE